MERATTISQVEANNHVSQPTAWRTLYYRFTTEDGSFRLKDQRKRVIEFSPLQPIPLVETDIAPWLMNKFAHYKIKIKNTGEITLELGLNAKIGPIADQIAYFYHKFLKEKRKEQNEEGKQLL